MSGDRGDIVVGWLTRLAVGLTVFGVLVFDAASVGLAQVGVQDDANAAAATGSDAFLESGNVQAAYAAAARYAEEHGGTIRPEEFSVETDGRVRLVLRSTATTLVLHRIGPLHRAAQVDASANVRSVPAS